MAARGFQWPTKALSRLLRMKPLPPSTQRPEILDSERLCEEETHPRMPLERFYPICMGEVLHDRYQVAAKLGWGGRSTVWLARDLQRWSWQKPQFVAVKVAISSSHRNELATLRKTTDQDPAHRGYPIVRTLLDHFNLHSSSGTHLCTVAHPLAEHITSFARNFEYGAIPADLMYIYAEALVCGLDYLHSECKVIHTDLHPSNIMTNFGTAMEQQILLKHEALQRDDPPPEKILRDRRIYLRHNFGNLAYSGAIGHPVITDFDHAVDGDEEPYFHAAQVDGYRAPEVVLGAPWSYPIDIWSLALVICKLIQGRTPFDPSAKEDESFSHDEYLANIIACMGLPPSHLLAQGKNSSELFYFDGHLRRQDVTPSSASLYDFFSHVKYEEKKPELVDMITRMLNWDPAGRPTAAELLDDPFLQNENTPK